MRDHNAIFAWMLILIIALLSGCDKSQRSTAGAADINVAQENASATDTDSESREEPGKQQSEAAQKPPASRQEEFENYIETGDLDALKKRGTIRFVSLAGGREELLFRKAIINERHYDMAMAFAKQLELEPVWIQAKTPVEAIQMLRDGEADIFADNVTDTEERRKLIDVSIPILKTYFYLVAGEKGPEVSDVDKLQNIEFTVLADTVFEDAAKEMITKRPDAQLRIQEVYLEDRLDTLIDDLNENPNTVTILAGNYIDNFEQYRNDFRQGAKVSDEKSVVWAFRKESPKLKTRLDNYFTQRLVTWNTDRPANWKAIKQSKVVRFLTYNGPSYFLWKGVLVGFDYDLAKAFADKHNLNLQIVVVPHEESLIEWLKQGRGDFAGSFTTITEERKKQGVDFTVPYTEMAEQIISHKGKPAIASLEDLNGRTLTLRAHTTFIDTAEALQQSGIDVKVEVAPADISYHRLINMVADGEIEATIVDSDFGEVEAALRPELLLGAVLGDPRPQGWMVDRGNDELRQELDSFLTEIRKSKKYGKIVSTYLKPNNYIVQKMKAPVVPGGKLSPYDELVRKSALKYGFDWRLVVAQMWQESNFNPKAESPVGAQGLLQVMPRTAEEMGFKPPLFDPDRGIRAGVKYLDWVRDRFDPATPIDTKLWFTLASYNAGYGHLLDAQRLAKQLGLDPNEWFDNVEVAMLKLSEPRYFKKARYGYVRGAEPVQYVRNISALYKAYTDMATGDVSLIPMPGPRPPLKVSAQSCQYGRWIPSADAHRLHSPAGKWRQSAGGSCLRQSRATPSIPAHRQSRPSPVPTAVSGWSR
ncbi:membrane-bound lytic murein transglycosylase F [Microbulbifer marinus]|uniref:Membrane-bound lytic murein transglycosylase F n=1 Tax=Microbulbifer marinus TaxID=658218 RepID=A0A1H3WQ74_9GAMM|nr:membrane-bound lytic murein transglycosylase F [Microbulbifer marinus]